MRGRLITIEGLDGSGKTTLAEALVDELVRGGRDVVLLREPGGVELSERIRALVKDPGLSVDPRAEALLYAAARAQLVAERVSPLLHAGTWVLLDRFVDSTLAYQGVGRGLGVEAVHEINHFGTGGLRPDRTLLLRADANTRAARAGARSARARGRRLLRRHRRRLRRAGGGRARALPRHRRGRRAGGGAERRAGGAGRPWLASMPVLGRRGAIALTCAAVLLMPAAALASAYDDTLRDYRTTGAINGCKYTAAQLAQAKELTPKNIKDIAPGYPAQLEVAAAKRAKGCTKAEEKAASTATAAAGTTTGATTQPPATTTVAPNATTTAATPAPAPAPAPAAAATQPAAPSTSSHKAARLALIVVAALLLMLLALWGFARWWAWEPHWLARWRHATAEAGWRASAAWAEFTDWLRLGR